MNYPNEKFLKQGEGIHLVVIGCCLQQITASVAARLARESKGSLTVTSVSPSSITVDYKEHVTERINVKMREFLNKHNYYLNGEDVTDYGFIPTTQNLPTKKLVKNAFDKFIESLPPKWNTEFTEEHARELLNKFTSDTFHNLYYYSTD